MGADFKIVKEQPEGKPSIAVFHLAGWLDAQSEQQLVDAVQAAKDGGAQFVLLDLRQMTTITSAGIRALQKSYQLVTPGDEAGKVTHLKLCNAPAQVYEVLGITGLLINVPMYESLDDAVDSFHSA
ncbi:MAG TPA: STAS domain-containing protein [Anaerolineales bacterium]|nr:STAS domain-containing protein [Anaerolineales bacterium]